MGVPRTLDELLVNLAGRVDRLERRRSGGGGIVLPPQIGNDALMLGTTDLNTVFASGWYVQTANANATTARNYPVANRAGELEVTGNVEGYDFAMQRYTDYLGAHIYTRTHYNGTWKPWAEELPPRLSPNGQTITDWNDATEVGFYNGAVGIPNAPNSAGLFSGVVLRSASGRIVQDLVNMTTTVDAMRLTYRRVWSGSAWTAWETLHPVHNGGMIAHTASPTSFPYGITVGESDSSYPTGVYGVVEVVKHAGTRAVQRVTYKGDSIDVAPTYQRSAAGDGSTWGAWIQTAGDTGWATLTTQNAWLETASLGYRIINDVCYLRGEIYAGATQTVVFTLPSGARPPTRTAAMIARYATTSTPPFGSLTINTTGEATFILLGGTIPTGSPGLALRGISFPIT